MAKNTNFDFKVNNEITGFSSVRIIGEDIESNVVTFETAKKIAHAMNKDCILVNESAKPPIVRIDAYDKFIYNLKKADKKKKQMQKQNQLKEIQLSVSIASNDLKTKAKKAMEFIEDGDKVKVTLTMKGREINRKEENQKSLLEFIVLLEDVAIPESPIRNENNKFFVILKKKK